MAVLRSMQIPMNILIEKILLEVLCKETMDKSSKTGGIRCLVQDID